MQVILKRIVRDKVPFAILKGSLFLLGFSKYIFNLSLNLFEKLL